jgi:hypothetical protein
VQVQVRDLRAVACPHVLILRDARLAEFVTARAAELLEVMSFSSSSDGAHGQLSALVRQILSEHASEVWPHRRNHVVGVRDSNMFMLSAQTPGSFMCYRQTPMVHVVRGVSAYTSVLHLDIDVSLLGPQEDLRDHVNVWLPLQDYRQDPLVFMTKQTGPRLFSGDITLFAPGPDDEFCTTFLAPGEMFVFCSLLVPHSSMWLAGAGASTRTSAELRLQCVEVNTEAEVTEEFTESDNSRGARALSSSARSAA